MPQNAPRYMRLPRSGPGSRTVALVTLGTVVSVVVMAAMAVHVAYGELRRSVGETLPMVLEWSRERLGSRVEALPAQLEHLTETEAFRAWVARSGAQPGGRSGEGAGISLRALQPEPAFAGMVLLDDRGRIVARIGTGPAIDALAELLTEKDLEDSELVEVMQSANVRRELAATDTPSLRPIDIAGDTPSVVVSAPIHGPRARRTGSIHAVVRRQELERQLRADLLGGGSLVLVDGHGHVAAAAGDGGSRGEGRIHSGLRQAGADPEVVLQWNGTPSMVVTSALPAGVFDWKLVAQQTAASATGRLFLAFLQIAAVGAAVVALFALWATANARAMNRPLRSLFEGLQRLGNGDLDSSLDESQARGQIRALLRAFNAAVERLRQKQARGDANLRSLVEQNLAFQKQNDLLSTLSVTDGLTGLHNHRYFKEQIHREIKRQKRTHEDMALLIIDIDDFKQLNDRYGHAAGDEFLKQLARILEEFVRDTDVLVRYGGEEFVVLATGTDLEGAVNLAEKIRTQVAETSFIVDSSMRPRRVTVSVGVAKFKHSQSEMFTAADAALYRAKESGKNCVVAAEDESGSLP